MLITTHSISETLLLKHNIILLCWFSVNNSVFEKMWFQFRTLQIINQLAQFTVTVTHGILLCRNSKLLTVLGASDVRRFSSSRPALLNTLSLAADDAGMHNTCCTTENSLDSTARCSSQNLTQTVSRLTLRLTNQLMKKIKNRSTVAKVINKHQVAYFFETQCMMWK